MKVYYKEGPLKQTFGVAGEFLIGEPKEIDDALAEDLLRKKRVERWVDHDPEATKKKGK